MSDARAAATARRRQAAQRHQRACLLLGLAIAAVIALHLRFFLASPSGRFPALDGAENLALAQRIAQGTLPHEPFFRAMLYPACLSLFLLSGIGISWLPAIAALLGCAWHA